MASLDLYQTFPVWIVRLRARPAARSRSRPRCSRCSSPGSSCWPSRSSGAGSRARPVAARSPCSPSHVPNRGGIDDHEHHRDTPPPRPTPSGRPSAAAASRAAARPDPRLRRRPGPGRAVHRRWRPVSSSPCWGPSGCGKTTALRIAGRLRDGRHRVGPGRRQGHLPVPASPAGHGHGVPELQPVPEHVGARQRGLRAADAQDRRGRAAQAGRRPAGHGRPRPPRPSRYPHQLSGGQQQRVALARALAIRAPGAAARRAAVRARRQGPACSCASRSAASSSELGTTTLFVTHDQEEALSMADRVGVMSNGRLEQIARAGRAVRTDPATAFVAEFVGVMNRIPGELQAGASGHGSGRHSPGPGTPSEGERGGRPRPARRGCGWRSWRTATGS